MRFLRGFAELKQAKTEQLEAGCERMDQIQIGREAQAFLGGLWEAGSGLRQVTLYVCGSIKEEGQFLH